MTIFSRWEMTPLPMIIHMQVSWYVDPICLGVCFRLKKRRWKVEEHRPYLRWIEVSWRIAWKLGPHMVNSVYINIYMYMTPLPMIIHMQVSWYVDPICLGVCFRLKKRRWKVEEHRPYLRWIEVSWRIAWKLGPHMVNSVYIYIYMYMYIYIYMYVCIYIWLIIYV